jgi:predicted ABC-type exoprotein transport system permease subunit
MIFKLLRLALFCFQGDGSTADGPAFFHMRVLYRARLMISGTMVCSCLIESENNVAKTKKKMRKLYTAADVKLLKQHSKARTPVAKLSKLMKRSEGSLRQKALALGIGLGHQR